MIERLLKNAAVMAAAVAATAVMSAGAFADTLKVGVIGPFSGPFANWGIHYKNGIELYQKRHGLKVGDHDVELIFRDLADADVGRAKQLAQELVVREGVQYLAGLMLTPTSFAVAEIANAASVPLVVFNSTTSSLTRASPFLIRSGYSQWQVSVPMAEYAAKAGNKRIAIVSADYAPGQDAIAAFTHAFTEKGGEITDTIAMPMSTTDFASYIERLRSKRPDAVYLFAPVGPMSIGFLRAFIDSGLYGDGVKLYATGETQEPEVNIIGDGTIGMISALHYGPFAETAMNPDFVTELTAMHPQKQLPDMADVAAYDGMHLVYTMIEKTDGKADGKAAVESILGYSWESPRGPVSIDAETRDIIHNIYIREVTKRDDGVLYNRTIETFEAVKDPWKDINPEKAK